MCHCGLKTADQISCAPPSTVHTYFLTVLLSTLLFRVKAAFRSHGTAMGGRGIGSATRKALLRYFMPHHRFLSRTSINNKKRLIVGKVVALHKTLTRRLVESWRSVYVISTNTILPSIGPCHVFIRITCLGDTGQVEQHQHSRTKTTPSYLESTVYHAPSLIKRLGNTPGLRLLPSLYLTLSYFTSKQNLPQKTDSTGSKASGTSLVGLTHDCLYGQPTLSRVSAFVTGLVPFKVGFLHRFR